MLFRNDDVCFGFDYDKYKEVQGVFEEFGIKELYSVIPFGNNIYTPNAHLLGKQELASVLGEQLITEDDKADRFIKESLERGHEIGLHGWTHTLITLYSKEEQFDNIKKAKEFLESRYGKIKYFIPPFNSYDDNTVKVCNELGLQILGRNKSQLEWLVRDNEDIKDTHYWYHAWRFNNLDDLRKWLQQHYNQVKP